MYIVANKRYPPRSDFEFEVVCLCVDNASLSILTATERDERLL